MVGDQEHRAIRWHSLRADDLGREQNSDEHPDDRQHHRSRRPSSPLPGASVQDLVGEIRQSTSHARESDAAQTAARGRNVLS
jgi:hypothetical protein